MVWDKDTPFLISSDAIFNLSSTTLLPTTFPTISIDCKRGIPLDKSVDKVLVNLDVIIFVFVSFNIGILILRLSKKVFQSKFF